MTFKTIAALPQNEQHTLNNTYDLKSCIISCLHTGDSSLTFAALFSVSVEIWFTGAVVRSFRVGARRVTMTSTNAFLAFVKDEHKIKIIEMFVKYNF